MIREFSTADVRSLTFEHTDDGLLVTAKWNAGVDKVMCAQWLMDRVAFLGVRIDDIVTPAWGFEYPGDIVITEPLRIEGSTLEMTFAASLNRMDGKILTKFWFEEESCD